MNIMKTKYMVVSRHENAGQNQSLLIDNKCFQNVAKFKFLETRVTYQNFIHEEITSRLNSGNDYYSSLQRFMSSRLLSKNFKI
jgi:hypothetical protein